MSRKDSASHSRQNSPYKSVKTNQLRLIYGNKSPYLEVSKNHLSTKDQFGRTSACLSTNTKYDYVGDILESNSYSLKTEETSSNSKCKKPFRLIRSADKRTIKFADGDLEKLFNRVSMHAIKTKREFIEQHKK
jgi:hypothetical protein